MAEETPLLPLGPWPRGINNIEKETSAVFDPGRVKSPQLKRAVNVDLSRDGFVRRRQGRVKRMDLTSPQGIAAVNGMLLVVDDGVLKEVNVDTWEPRDLGFVGDMPLSFTEAGGVVYFVSETARGRIVDGEMKPWGLSRPSVSVSTAPGTMQAGSYLVAVTPELDGEEFGSSVPLKVELGENQAIQVVANAAGASHFNIYCTECNGRDLYFVKQVEAGQPIFIEEVGVSTDLLETANFYPPPYGQLVRAFRGWIVVASGRALFWSQSLAPSLFKIQEDFLLFKQPIRLFEPSLGGVYLGTENSMLWLQGNEPSEWALSYLERSYIPRGLPVRVPGSSFPQLETRQEIVVWPTEKGLVAGLPEGQVIALTQSSVAMNTYEDSSLIYREEDGIRQMLLALRNKKADSGMAATDRAFCEVIKAK